MAYPVLVALSSLEHFPEHVFVLFGMELLDMALVKNEFEVSYQSAFQSPRRVENDPSSGCSFYWGDFHFSRWKLCRDKSSSHDFLVYDSVLDMRWSPSDLKPYDRSDLGSDENLRSTFEATSDFSSEFSNLWIIDPHRFLSAPKPSSIVKAIGSRTLGSNVA